MPIRPDSDVQTWDMRVPSINPKRDREIARLQKLLADLQRIPPDKREAECADEREATIRAMLSDLEPKRIYRWSTDDDAIAEDAIMVGIGGTGTDMLYLGLTYVEPMASVSWCSRVTAMGFFEAGGDGGPMTVPDALQLADRLRDRMGYDRVVISLQEVGFWQEEWGRLAVREGY